MSIFDEFEYEAPDPASHDPRNKAFDILKREDITLLEGESVIGRNVIHEYDNYLKKLDQIDLRLNHLVTEAIPDMTTIASPGAVSMELVKRLVNTADWQEISVLSENRDRWAEKIENHYGRSVEELRNARAEELKKGYATTQDQEQSLIDAWYYGSEGTPIINEFTVQPVEIVNFAKNFTIGFTETGARTIEGIKKLKTAGQEGATSIYGDVVGNFANASADNVLNAVNSPIGRAVMPQLQVLNILDRLLSGSMTPDEMQEVDYGDGPVSYHEQDRGPDDWNTAAPANSEPWDDESSIWQEQAR